VTEEQLRKVFDPYGTIVELSILRGPDGFSKGCAFLKYEHRQEAISAINACHGQVFMPVRRHLLHSFLLFFFYWTLLFTYFFHIGRSSKLSGEIRWRTQEEGRRQQTTTTGLLTRLEKPATPTINPTDGLLHLSIPIIPNLPQHLHKWTWRMYCLLFAYWEIYTDSLLNFPLKALTTIRRIRPNYQLDATRFSSFPTRTVHQPIGQPARSSRRIQPLHNQHKRTTHPHATARKIWWWLLSTRRYPNPQRCIPLHVLGCWRPNP